MELDRRTFLKGVLAAGSLTAAGGALVACGGDEAQTPAPNTPASGSGGTADSGVFTPEDLQRKWAFEIAPDPIGDDKIVETIDADVVVVGCGTSGLMTAISALEHGAGTVVIVSASAAPVSRGGSNNTVYSKYMASIGMEKIPAQMYKKEIYAQYNNVNQALWYKFYNNSEESMNYLIDLMTGRGYTVAMELNDNMPKDDLYYQPLSSHAFLDGVDFKTPGTAQPLLVRNIAEVFEEKGGKIYYQNKGVQLTRGGIPNGTSGRVDGVIVERLEDGSYAKYTASKAVVLACGDFSKDRDMCYKYIPAFAPYLEEMGAFSTPVDYDKGLDPFNAGLMPGDGHKMGLWVGAAWEKNNPNTLMGATFSSGPAGTYGQSNPGLVVDRNGRRFMDEFCSNRLGGMSRWHTDGSQAFGIWDAGYASYPNMWRETWDVTSAVVPPDQVLAGWDQGVENGFYFKADTLDDLCQQLGLPVEATKATIERYNQMCDDGVDTDFYKRKEGLNAVRTPPFYGSKSGAPDFLTVLGGLRTNTELQVCDEADTPLGGLYNVGTMIGDFFGGVYTFQIQGANYGAACVTLGWETGKYIAANE
jgi:succinate dehydrogenase/fumarate reductase flavoprotein subunit